MSTPSAALHDIAAAADLQPLMLRAQHGRLLVTVHGGRVLGVFLEGFDENLLWVNPQALGDAESAKRFVAAGEWNLGGDRCWLAPEIDLHFLDAEHPSHENYAVPAAIDPGRYAVQREAATGVAMESGGEVTNLRTRRPFSFETARSICLCPPPLDPDGLSYLGYVLSSELRVLSPDGPDACYGLWQLVQIPPGGEVYISLRRPPEIVDYFQTGVSSHCHVRATHAVFPVTGQAKHKLGLRTADATGTMAYYRPGPAGMATLIVRQAAVFAGAVYADYPAHQPQRRDVALQFYNDSGEIGGFGEMEYHSPAAGSANFFHTRDVSHTWCFGGPAERVRHIAQQLLGVAEVG